eukprot:1194927-Prorocentrum_minimum.AAC.3
MGYPLMRFTFMHVEAERASALKHAHACFYNTGVTAPFRTCSSVPTRGASERSISRAWMNSALYNAPPIRMSAQCISQ